MQSEDRWVPKNLQTSYPDVPSAATKNKEVEGKG